VLANTFKNVDVARTDNPGYDFICDRGKKVDVKSATKRPGRDAWQFNIHKNTIADYFLCLAFDNRDNLVPLHLWLIPGDVVNRLQLTSVTERTIEKWGQYNLDELIPTIAKHVSDRV